MGGQHVHQNDDREHSVRLDPLRGGGGVVIRCGFEDLRVTNHVGAHVTGLVVR